MAGNVAGSRLPIERHRDEIVDKVRRNQVVIIVGDTGCGKSTQVSQYLYWSGASLGFERSSMIACLHPRSIAAVSLAERVASEMGSEVGGLVGYRIRFYSEYSTDTRIVYMTAGYMSRLLSLHGKLGLYRVVVVDEAHDRSVQNDVVMGQMKTLLAKDKRLRLVVMSATLDEEMLAAYYPGAASVHVQRVPSLVNVVYRLPTSSNYVATVVEVVQEILKTSKNGHILIFLPTEEKVYSCKKLLKGLLEEFPGCRILKFYSAMDKNEKLKVFKEFGGRRKIVVATNIAETSLTIPGVLYVVDSGLVRRVTYQHGPRLECGNICRLSLAEADQRRGRTGRTGPGTCYRLYPQEDIDPVPAVRVALESIPFMAVRGEASITNLAERIVARYSLRQQRVLQTVCADQDLRGRLNSDTEEGVFLVIKNIMEVAGVSDFVAWAREKLMVALTTIEYFRAFRKEQQQLLVDRLLTRYTLAQIYFLTGRKNLKIKRLASEEDLLRRLEGILQAEGLSTDKDVRQKFCRYPPAEIFTADLGSTILFLKALGYEDLSTFPFLEAPDQTEVDLCTRHLRDLSLLDDGDRLTPMGRHVSVLPMSAALGKVAVVGSRSPSWRYIYIILALLSVRFIIKPKKRNNFKMKHGDLFTLLDVYTKAEFYDFDKDWCKTNGVFHANINYAKKILDGLEYSLPPDYSGWAHPDWVDDIRFAFMSAFFLNLAVKTPGEAEKERQRGRDRNNKENYILPDDRSANLHESCSLQPPPKIVMPVVLYGPSEKSAVSMRLCTNISVDFLHIDPAYYNINTTSWRRIRDSLRLKL